MIVMPVSELIVFSKAMGVKSSRQQIADHGAPQRGDFLGRHSYTVYARKLSRDDKNRCSHHKESIKTRKPLRSVLYCERRPAIEGRTDI
jgi:hypothetical protein